MKKLNWDNASFSLTDLAVISMLRFVSGLGEASPSEFLSAYVCCEEFKRRKVIFTNSRIIARSHLLIERWVESDVATPIIVVGRRHRLFSHILTELASLRVSDLRPNSNRLRRASEAFLCLRPNKDSLI
jgi:hypothetical protein